MKRRRGIPNSSGWRPVGCGCFTEAAGRLQAGWMVPRKNGLQSEEFYGTITHGKEIAGVMELADVTDSKSVGGDTVWVRVPPPAPSKRRPVWGGAFGCRKSGLRHFFEVFIAPLRLRRGQGAMQGNPCYARLFADLTHMSPNPIKASGGCGPRTPRGFSTA